MTKLGSELKYTFQRREAGFFVTMATKCIRDFFFLVSLPPTCASRKKEPLS